MSRKKPQSTRRIHTRKLDRGIARHRLSLVGRLHKLIKSGDFAKHWHEYAK